MSRERQFEPDWISPPGDTIADILQQRKISPTEFAHTMGRSSAELNDLILGEAKITIEMAQKLESVLGGSTAFWMVRESQYREDQVRLGRTPVSDAQWVSDLPINEMIRFGWLPPEARQHNTLAECLSFFDVLDIAAWRKRYTRLLQEACFRKSTSFQSHAPATAAWLRRGEIEAERIVCRPWNGESFRRTLIQLRQLTRKRDPEAFIPELTKQCAECGVAVVIVPAPSGCRASGATWFLSSDKAVLLLSVRYMSDEQFWFSLFHEAGHLLLHNREALFLEGYDTVQDKAEEEANEFAADILVPPQFRQRMLKLPVNGFDVIRFAKLVGIAPGIVVGQLQHHGRFTHRQLNNLKRRFVWKLDNDREPSRERL